MRYENSLPALHSFLGWLEADPSRWRQVNWVCVADAVLSRREEILDLLGTGTLCLEDLERLAADFGALGDLFEGLVERAVWL